MGERDKNIDPVCRGAGSEERDSGEAMGMAVAVAWCCATLGHGAEPPDKFS